MNLLEQRGADIGMLAERMKEAGCACTLRPNDEKIRLLEIGKESPKGENTLKIEPMPEPCFERFCFHEQPSR